MFVVVHVATKGYVGACDFAVDRRWVDAYVLGNHQSLWSVLLPEAIMVYMGFAIPEAMLMAVAHAAAKGLKSVSSPCCLCLGAILTSMV